MPEPKSGGLSATDQARVRSAMLSVYYQASARTYRVSGAPAVVLPPDIQLDSLGAALQIVQELDPARMREALWLVVRNERLQGRRDDPVERYDEEAVPFLTRDHPSQLRELADLRRSHRSRGNILGTILTACRDHDYAQLPGLVQSYRAFGGDEAAAIAAMVLGEDADDFLRLVGSTRPGRTGTAGLDRYRLRVHTIEADVGRPISAYVSDLAAAAAFRTYCDGPAHPVPDAGGPLVIYPVSLTVSQERATLMTTAVVSTYAEGPESALLLGTAPQNWAGTSDVIRGASYIADPFTFDPLPDGEAEATLRAGGSVLLDEHAAVAWGRDGEAQSSFHNVLAITRTEARTADDPAIDIGYHLCRSVDSQVMWDRRPGGMDLNEGYYRVWRLGEERWRISVRKHLRFTDRTPDNASPQDLGQALNYLAPASITWWLETETYNLSRYPSGDGETRRQAARAGAEEVTS